jgi:hypothetical protein
MRHRFLNWRYQANGPIEKWLQAILKEQGQRIAGAEPTETCTPQGAGLCVSSQFDSETIQLPDNRPLEHVHKHLAWKRALYTRRRHCH